MKPKRHQDKRFLSWVKTLRCIHCGSDEVDPAHIKSVGSGGGDTWDNVLPLCREAHSFQHQHGWSAFVDQNFQILFQLEIRGWTFENRQGIRKLVRK